MDRRFLLKRFRVISFSFYVDTPPQTMLSEDFTPLSAEVPQKMGRSSFGRISPLGSLKG
jgi:hypothetical protein